MVEDLLYLECGDEPMVAAARTFGGPLVTLSTFTMYSICYCIYCRYIAGTFGGPLVALSTFTVVHCTAYIQYVLYRNKFFFTLYILGVAMTIMDGLTRISYGKDFKKTKSNL